jgi:hypothetical protein
MLCDLTYTELSIMFIIISFDDFNQLKSLIFISKFSI